MEHVSYHSRPAIIAITCFFYLEVGFVIALIAVLVPEVIQLYSLNYSVAAMLPFAYYLSFALFAMPAGIVADRFQYKTLIFFSLALTLSGVIVFILGSNFLSAALSLFTIGCGLTILQVVAVPLLRQVVGSSKMATYSALTMLMYGVGAFLCPMIYSQAKIVYTGKTEAAIVMFVIAGSLFIVTALLVLAIKFPLLRISDDLKVEPSVLKNTLLKNRNLLWLFFALVAYSCCEQGISNWLIRFIENYHSNTPVKATDVLSYYWILLSAGCVIGMFLLERFKSSNVLLVFVSGALCSLFIALYGNSVQAIAGFLIVGLFHSIMWPVIISIALNLFSNYQGTVAGFMFTASIGGAIGPMVVGQIADFSGLKTGFLFIAMCYVFILIVIARMAVRSRRLQLISSTEIVTK